MNKEKLKELLLDYDQRVVPALIDRELKQRIDEHATTPFVTIISGIRRCGKSSILQQLRQQRSSYYVDFDDDRLVNFTVEDFQLLYELLLELFGEREVFVFDEIQNIPGWERFVRRLHNLGYKVYVSGSNASMLSRELGTHLTGRSLTFSLFPFSFREFLTLNGEQTTSTSLSTKQKANLKRLFSQYVREGGFPEFLQTKKDEYLKAVYEHILYRDIITRYKLSHEKPLKEVVYYVASNVGKELSFNSLRKLTGLSSATTIREYFEYLEHSYLVFLIPRYDYSLKKQLYYNKKAYFIDTALTGLLGFRTSDDNGRMLENVVFLQLKRQGHELFFHRDTFECDFLIRQGVRITHAIQVTQSLAHNKDREVGGLLEAMKQYKLKEGQILTEDESGEITQGRKKITIKPIWQWLLETQG